MMLKLKLQYFGHLKRRVDSLEKTLMLGGIRGRRRRGWQRMRWLVGITDLMDVSLSELRELVMDREAWRAVLYHINFIGVVQLLSRVRLFVTPWTAAHQASLSFTISLSLFKLRSIESVMSSSHLILCCPLFLLPSIFPSINLFQWVSSSHQVTKELELQLQR